MNKLTINDFTWMTSRTIRPYYEHRTSGGSICIEMNEGSVLEVVLYDLEGNELKREQVDNADESKIGPAEALERAVEVANELV